MTRRKCSEIRPGAPAPGMAARIGETIDTRRGVEYRELRAASLVNRFNARPMPFGWTANPYRGCEMACRYCYARYTHEFLGQNDPQTYVEKIEARVRRLGAEAGFPTRGRCDRAAAGRSSRQLSLVW